MQLVQAEQPGLLRQLMPHKLYWVLENRGIPANGGQAGREHVSISEQGALLHCLVLVKNMWDTPECGHACTLPMKAKQLYRSSMQVEGTIG